MQRAICRYCSVQPSPEILYEDNHVLALHKPAGMPSQADASGDLSAFDWTRQYIKQRYNKPGEAYAALLHRLDRPVGGVLLLAKTSKAATRLTDQFKDREVQKTYLAICERVPAQPQGSLQHYLAKLPGKNIVRAYDKPAYGAQLAQLDYELLEVQGTHSLLRVQPHTGRQHQIRVQLARMGCVICGDVKYGKTAFLPDASIALYAHQLQLAHPITKDPLAFTAWPPTTAPWLAFTHARKP